MWGTELVPMVRVGGGIKSQGGSPVRKYALFRLL